MIHAAAGLLLGLAGSGHCLAMCGPLVALADGAGHAATPGVRWRRRGAYHAGRLGAYVALGAIAGVAGTAMRDWGLGRGLAIGAGLVLVGQAWLTVAGGSPASTSLASRWTAGLIRLTGWLRRHAAARPAVVGALNGLLPCGLVYAALVAAAGIGDAIGAMAMMGGFGVGTVPALVGAGAASALPWRLGPAVRRVAVPVALAAAGLLLLVRGLAPDAHVHAPAPVAAAAPVHAH